MDFLTLNAYQQMCLRRLRQLTWPWLASGTIAVVCLGFYLAVVAPAQQALNDMHARVWQLRQEIRQSDQLPPVLAGDATPAQLAAFYGYFPEDRSLPDWLEKIQQVATANGLSLNEGDYQIERDHTDRLLRCRIIFPVRARYLVIRRFIAGVLTNIPNVALDSVNFERPGIGAGVVDARIGLTLYLERGT